jgi:hypothetical protein
MSERCLLFLLRGQTFFEPPHRQGICARGEHAERWSGLILALLRKLNFGRRLLGSSPSAGAANARMPTPAVAAASEYRPSRRLRLWLELACLADLTGRVDIRILHRANCSSVALIRSRRCFAPPQRQTICARGEHAERWSTLILNVLGKLNLGCRLLGSSRQDQLVGDGFVGVGRDRSRPCTCRLCKHRQSYPAVMDLAVDPETNPDIAILGIPSPEAIELLI